MIQKVTTQNFDQIVLDPSAPLAICLLSRPGCGGCTNFKPIFEQLSNEHTDITFCEIDIEAHPALAFGAWDLPGLVYFRQGTKLVVYAGSDDQTNEASIRNHILDFYTNPGGTTSTKKSGALLVLLGLLAAGWYYS